MVPRLPQPRVYFPRLRRDQVKGLYHLKQREGRPMTTGAGVDHYLERLGGMARVIRGE